jgi:hypothetical protein
MVRSDPIESLILVVVLVGVGVWLISVLSTGLDLGVLPRRRRRRVEWCRRNVRRVVLASSILIALLVLSDMTHQIVVS